MRKALELSAPNSVFLNTKDVCMLLDVSRETLMRMIHCGNFPAAIDVPGMKFRWRRSVVMDWVDRQASG